DSSQTPPGKQPRSTAQSLACPASAVLPMPPSLVSVTSRRTPPTGSRPADGGSTRSMICCISRRRPTKRSRLRRISGRAAPPAPAGAAAEPRDPPAVPGRVQPELLGGQRLLRPATAQADIAGDVANSRIESVARCVAAQQGGQEHPLEVETGGDLHRRVA